MAAAVRAATASPAEVPPAQSRAAKSLTVGEVARRSGLAVSAIHFYERQGLIAGWRTAGNQRRYERAVLRRIAIIQVAQRAGLSLGTIAEFLPLDGRIDHDGWAKMARAWQMLIDERRELLRRLRDELGSCIGCGCLSLEDCPLRNPGDELAKAGAGARILER